LLAPFPGKVTVERLPNGLTVAVLESPQAPIVTSALWYRVGTRDEPAGQGGIAHFLEHMMFKGSSRYGPGEVDRHTQRLGGDNNAFTSHDATAYHFSFATETWREALAIESDRMRGLRLDPAEVESERRVILEEISMYEDEPWDALSTRVEAALYGPHPYGKPVLGTREELLAIGPEELAAFHRTYYRPERGVLVVGGDVGAPAEVVTAVAEAFGDWPAPPATPPDRPAVSRRETPRGELRLTRYKGEVARLLWALPCPEPKGASDPALRLLVSALGGGRSSRLVRQLVDEEQLCAWATVDHAEMIDPGMLGISAELVPDVEPERVELRIRELLARAVCDPPRGEELERARAVLLADWTFGHERVFQQTLAVGAEYALYEPGWTARQLAGIATASAEDVAAAAARVLTPEVSSVIGWSLPDEDDEDEEESG
jgi:zinc protease